MKALGNMAFPDRVDLPGCSCEIQIRKLVQRFFTPLLNASVRQLRSDSSMDHKQIQATRSLGQLLSARCCAEVSSSMFMSV